MEYDRAYFAGKVAAVTGGASGIGLALCEELLECGAQAVVLADFNKDNLAQHEKRLDAQYPGRVKGVFCNVTVEENVQNMVAEATAFGGGRLDLLINCAGAALAGAFIDLSGGRKANSALQVKTSTNEDWEKGFALNFYGALYGCRAALPIMTAQGAGQIVNIISGIAFSPMAYQSMYAATKSALLILSESLRYEYWDAGVKISAATPGTTATAIFKDTGAPPEAQSPHDSASRILRGTVENRRLILGDDGDVRGAKVAFFPDGASKLLDSVFLGFARQRRSGTLSFGTDDKMADAPLDESMIPLGEIMDMDWSDMGPVLEKVQAYVVNRVPPALDPSYYAGKTALVTGSASGIGLALVETLLKCGADKVVLADKNQASLDAQYSRLDALYPGKVRGVCVDIAEEASVQAMIAQAVRFFGNKFDLLINCAGIPQTGLFTDRTDAGAIGDMFHGKGEPQSCWEQVFRVNFYGALYACRAALPIMIGQGGGQIVNIISGIGFIGMPFHPIYASSKAALNMLTLALRYEYWDHHVMINSATPGTVATPIHALIGTPKNAITPEQSARRILAGAARNDRLICGDDADLLTSMLTYGEDAAHYMDDLLLGIARNRISGKAYGF